MTKSQLLAQMDVSMGGRVAEELVFGPDKVTTGTENSNFCSCIRYTAVNLVQSQDVNFSLNKFTFVLLLILLTLV